MECTLPAVRSRMTYYSLCFTIEDYALWKKATLMEMTKLSWFTYNASQPELRRAATLVKEVAEFALAVRAWENETEYFG